MSLNTFLGGQEKAMMEPTVSPGISFPKPWDLASIKLLISLKFVAHGYCGNLYNVNIKIITLSNWNMKIFGLLFARNDWI